jgi:hypothetical protein
MCCRHTARRTLQDVKVKRESDSESDAGWEGRGRCQLCDEEMTEADDLVGDERDEDGS